MSDKLSDTPSQTIDTSTLTKANTSLRGTVSQEAVDLMTSWGVSLQGNKLLANDGSVIMDFNDGYFYPWICLGVETKASKRKKGIQEDVLLIGGRKEREGTWMFRFVNGPDDVVALKEYPDKDRPEIIDTKEVTQSGLPLVGLDRYERDRLTTQRLFAELEGPVPVGSVAYLDELYKVIKNGSPTSSEEVEQYEAICRSFASEVKLLLSYGGGIAVMENEIRGPIRDVSYSHQTTEQGELQHGSLVFTTAYGGQEIADPEHVSFTPAERITPDLLKQKWQDIKWPDFPPLEHVGGGIVERVQGHEVGVRDFISSARQFIRQGGRISVMKNVKKVPVKVPVLAFGVPNDFWGIDLYSDVAKQQEIKRCGPMIFEDAQGE